MNLINTQIAGVEQRKVELDILCDLGTSKEQIRAMLLREGQFISLSICDGQPEHAQHFIVL